MWHNYNLVTAILGKTMFFRNYSTLSSRFLRNSVLKFLFPGWILLALTFFLDVLQGISQSSRLGSMTPHQAVRTQPLAQVNWFKWERHVKNTLSCRIVRADGDSHAGSRCTTRRFSVVNVLMRMVLIWVTALPGRANFGAEIFLSHSLSANFTSPPFPHNFFSYLFH